MCSCPSGPGVGLLNDRMWHAGQDFMRLFDKAATDPEEAEPDEDDEDGKDVESGHHTPNGRDMSLRDQYSPGRGPLFNGSAYLAPAQAATCPLMFCEGSHDQRLCARTDWHTWIQQC